MADIGPFLLAGKKHLVAVFPGRHVDHRVKMPVEVGNGGEAAISEMERMDSSVLRSRLQAFMMRVLFK